MLWVGELVSGIGGGPENAKHSLGSAAAGRHFYKGEENMSEILVVKKLCKAGILKDISFTINTGEMTAVMGPSGSGKSTLLYQVSGGQLQRACICRSMMNQPKILFADEPTGALNQGAAREVMEEFVRLNREGTRNGVVTGFSQSCFIYRSIFFRGR